jgi:DNA-binding CsgD family transcriptional regulator
VVAPRDRPQLTERERSILELLPTHLSYAQIAKELYLSVNTVKTSLKVIYRKLGAGKRGEAVDQARAVGLLHVTPVRFDRGSRPARHRGRPSSTPMLPREHDSVRRDEAQPIPQSINPTTGEGA